MSESVRFTRSTRPVGADALGGVIAWGLAGGLAAAVALALVAPAALWPFLAVAGAVGVALLCFLHPLAFSVGFLVVAATTPEMWLADLVGGEALIVALVKFAGLAIALLAALRYGARADPFNPGFAYLVIFATGLLHGLHPNLSLGESVRTLLGSAAPYAFAFVRAPRRWSEAVIRTTLWLPLIVVVSGAVLALAGLRPLLMEVDGLRLAATGHPAFLAGFALAAIYAGLVELFRAGGIRDLGLLAVNVLILALTGARAPMMMAAAVATTAVAFVPSRAFPALRRLPVILAGGLALIALALFAEQITSIRLFHVLNEEVDSLSGREVIWPYFQDAWQSSPWLGWGMGAAKMLIDPESPVARLLGTTTAHNEYLRIGVDGGWMGLGVLIAAFALWAITRTRSLPASDKIILRLVFVAFAVHSFTDSTLIATTASVLFAWIAAVFARGDREVLERDLPETEQG
jgi:O-antigen ligase